MSSTHWRGYWRRRRPNNKRGGQIRPARCRVIRIGGCQRWHPPIFSYRIAAGASWSAGWFDSASSRSKLSSVCDSASKNRASAQNSRNTRAAPLMIAQLPLWVKVSTPQPTAMASNGPPRNRKSLCWWGSRDSMSSPRDPEEQGRHSRTNPQVVHE